MSSVHIKHSDASCCSASLQHTRYDPTHSYIVSPRQGLRSRYTLPALDSNHSNLLAHANFTDVGSAKSPATPRFHSGAEQGQLLHQPARQGGQHVLPLLLHSTLNGRILSTRIYVLRTKSTITVDQVPRINHARATHPSAEDICRFRNSPTSRGVPFRQRTCCSRIKPHRVGYPRLSFVQGP